MSKTVKLVFKNKYGKQVNINSLRADGSHHYINYRHAMVACEGHLDRCAEGAYVEINDQPKFTLSQMDLALYHFFND